MITLTDFRYEGGSNFTGGSIPEDWENDLDDLPACARWMAREVPGPRLGNSHLHQVINVRGLKLACPIATQVGIDHVIGKDDNNVGTAFRLILAQ
jgi:hypothetical protein